MVTRGGKRRVHSRSEQADARLHEIAGGAVHRADDAVPRRADRQFHLHRLEDDQGVAARDGAPGSTSTRTTVAGIGAARSLGPVLVATADATAGIR